MALWVHLLLMANHEESTFIWNNHKQTLKSGQLLTGRKKLAEQTGIPSSNIYRMLNYLENEHQIEQQKTNKYTVITIKNWGTYQKEDSKVNNKWTTNGQQMDTYKKDKKDKNEKKDTGPSVLSNDSFKRELSDKFSINISVISGELETMTDWLKSTGKKYKDYKAFARGWIRRGVKSGSLTVEKQVQYLNKKKE